MQNKRFDHCSIVVVSLSVHCTYQEDVVEHDKFTSLSQAACDCQKHRFCVSNGQQRYRFFVVFFVVKTCIHVVV